MNARKTLRGSSGFTLAELLIVMAIVLVLAALAIPSFTKNLEQSRETTDISAVRAAYSEVISSAMLGSADLRQGDGTYQAVVSPLKQLSDGWNLEVTNMDIAGINGADWQGTPKAGGKCTVKYDPTTDKCTIIWGGLRGRPPGSSCL